MQCPQCQRTRIVKDGHRYPNGEDIQRFMCKDCTFRFSEKPKYPRLTNGNRQVCVTKAKNLTSTTETKTVAGETNRTIDEAKGKILELCIHLKRQGYGDETIRLNRIALKVLMDRGANLYDDGSVKDVIVRQT